MTRERGWMLVDRDRDRGVEGVAVLRWPSESAGRRVLATEQRARLLLVDATTEPPQVRDALEDWMRVPGDPVELYTRRRALERRQSSRTPAFVDADGLLRRGSGWVALAPRETALLRLLVERRGRVVTRTDLLAAVGATAATDQSRLLDRALHRLRRRVNPLGVAIHTVRGSGFVLELGEVPDPPNWR